MKILQNHISYNFLGQLQFSQFFHFCHLLNIFIREELGQPNRPEDDLEPYKGNDKDDLPLLVDSSRFLHLVNRLTTFCEEAVPQFIRLLIASLNPTKVPDSVHCLVIFIGRENFLDVEGDVGVVDHDDDDDIEGVGEEVVDHLEIGCLGNHGIDAALDVGDDNHGCDGHHDSVLETKHVSN